MTKYVAFLRGVNVGGRIIKMVELKQCLEAAGLKNVSTFLQSGNVVFDSDKNEQQLKGLIESTMSETFSYSAKVIVTSMDDLKKIVDNNCYGDAPEDYHQYVIFFENGLEKDFVTESVGSTDEEVAAGQGVAYWKVRKGQTLKSTRGKLLSKARYKQFNTNRNINTLQKIISKN
jgi:uncharacterized protein (DUF1697 family)